MSHLGWSTRETMEVCLVISDTYDIYEAACRFAGHHSDPIVAYQRFVAGLGFHMGQKVPYAEFTWGDGLVNRLEVVEHLRDIQREYEDNFKGCLEA